MARLPNYLGDLVDLPLLAVLATYRADGTALLSPVWHEYRDGGFCVCTSDTDIKARHLRRAPGPSWWSPSLRRLTGAWR